jgi:hypothetical protein
LEHAWALNIRALKSLCGGKSYVHSCLCELFDVSLKAGSLRGGNEGIEHHGIEASSVGRASSNKRKRQGKGALHRNESHLAPLSVRGRGRRQNSVKAKASRVLLDSEGGGGSEDLPPVVNKSFQEGSYSPSTRMEMSEWQIMLE